MIPANFDRRAHWIDPDSDSEEVRQINGGKLHRFSTPEFYLKIPIGEQMMMSVIPRLAAHKMSILEYGCNTGRCLVRLRKLGFTNLTGLEISPRAIALGRKTFPELKDVRIINAAIEDAVKDLPEFDVIYGVGVLMHMPPECDWAIRELFSRAKVLIMTSENEEETDGYFKWARNYKDIIEPLGWVQVETETGDKYPPYPKSTVKRVFLRESPQVNID